MHFPSLSTFNAHLKRPWILLSIGMVLLLVRAWPRLLHPGVWDEDGTYCLPGFLQHGLANLAEPIGGYLHLAPKLLTMLAASISISQYPMIVTLLAFGFMLAVFYIMATAPVRLQGGVLLAVAFFLVPSDPEVFGLPLYATWWLSLLIFVVAFWNDQPTHGLLRSAIIILAFLSSPVAMVVLPFLWGRAWLLRGNRLEVRLALLATLCAAIQASVLLHYPGLVLSQSRLAASIQVIPKFLGAYAIGNIRPDLQWFFGSVILLFFMAAFFHDPRSPVKWGLIYLWFASALMVMRRVDIAIIHQVSGGPRYFLYPFVIQSWLLLQIALSDSSRWLRRGAWFILLLSLLNALPVLDRKHDELNWKMHLASCLHFDGYAIPVHYDGNAAQAWDLPMTKGQCTALLAKDPFAGSVRKLPGFPLRVFKGNPIDRPLEASDVTVKFASVQQGNGWLGTDFDKSRGEGMVVLGSFGDSDANAGSLTLKMKRGDRLRYRTGPTVQRQFIEILGSDFPIMTVPGAQGWVLLDFSSDLLPAEFFVKFSDHGSGWGEWSAVGLKKDE